MSKKQVILTSFVFLCMSMFAFPLKAETAGYYYTDNDYEKSSTYAGVDNRNDIKTIPVEKTDKNNVTTSTIQDGEIKKVYNTIIVKTKKKQEQKPEEPKKIEKIEKKPVQIQEITVKPAKKEEEPKKEESTTKSNVLKKIREAFRPFRQKNPDDWYLYAMAGYTMIFPKSITMSFVDYKEEATKKMNGFGFIAGIKIYFNNDKFALFIAPEAFYNKVNLASANFSYKSKVLSEIDDTTDPSLSPAPRAEVALPVPTNTSIKTQDMFGGTFRLGVTLVNVLSLYGKISIGSLRYGINSTLKVSEMSKADWDTLLGQIPSTVDYENAKQNVIRVWNDPETGKYYLGAKAVSATKNALLYGIGAGIEIGMWNQHLLLRLDYDHYFSSSTLSFKSQFVPYNSSDSTKIKVKSSFGILKFSAGLAF